MKNQYNDELAFWNDESKLIMDKLAINPKVKGLDRVELLKETFRFLSLVQLYHGNLTPSKVVDECWHEMILFTRSYHDFCHQFHGRFIHHEPSKDHRVNANQYERTLKLYETQFGKASEIYWPTSQIEISQCGPCEST